MDVSLNQLSGDLPDLPDSLRLANFSANALDGTVTSKP